MHFSKHFQNRRQAISGFLMTIWLFSWIGMTLLHNFSHAIHLDEQHAPCAVCRVLPQAATAVLETKLAVRHAAVFEFVGEIQTATIAFRSQVSFASTVPRGPPSLLFV